MNLKHASVRFDFHTLPGDSNERLPRKSLKKLRKIARRKGIHEDANNSEDGVAEEQGDMAGEYTTDFRKSVRDWSPIPDVNAYRDGLLEILKRDGANVKPETSAMLDPAGDGACRSHVSSAHRRLVRSRDELYSSFGKAALARAEKTYQKCLALREKQATWEKGWSQGVRTLTDSHE